MSNAYYKALQSRKPITAIPSGWTRAEVEAAIVSATAELKGPMHNAMRVAIVHERDNLRDMLALMDKAQESPADERDRGEG